jgi:hypothetical protein
LRTTAAAGRPTSSSRRTRVPRRRRVGPGRSLSTGSRFDATTRASSKRSAGTGKARNSGSPYYRFLAHWNALEAVFYGPTSRSGRAAFLDRVTPTAADAWTAYPLPEKPSEHFDEASRDAIAHVFRGAGTRPLIDPDADSDRQRLDWESRFVEWLVPHAIREVFGEPVAVERG